MFCGRYCTSNTKSFQYTRLPSQSGQYKAVSYVLDANDIVVALPTGFGKSLIFEILRLALDELKSMLLPILTLYMPHYNVSFVSGMNGSIVLCISPLTSLMMDQREVFSIETFSGVCW